MKRSVLVLFGVLVLASSCGGGQKYTAEEREIGKECFEIFQQNQRFKGASIDASAEFPIPTEHRAVIPPSSPDRKSFREMFVPNEDEIMRADRATVRHLSNAPEYPENTPLMDRKYEIIIHRLKDYYVQYVGEVTRNSTGQPVRMVHSYFFYVFPIEDCVVMKNAPPPETWKTEIVKAMGGGTWFWAISYSLDSDHVESFHVNASK